MKLISFYKIIFMILMTTNIISNQEEITYEVSSAQAARGNWFFEFANDSLTEGWITVNYDKGPIIVDKIHVPYGQRIRIQGLDLSKNIIVRFDNKTIFNTIATTVYMVTPHNKTVFIGIDFANNMMPQRGILANFIKIFTKTTDSGMYNSDNVSQEDLHFISHNR